MFTGITPLATAEAPRQTAGIDYPTCLPGPFAHGIASGDPLADRVIIWTRVMPERVPSPVGAVRWAVAVDPDMRTVVASGVQIPGPELDHTVKVDVTGLSPATTYYYRFTLGDEHSITGRTRTAPAPGNPTTQVRIAAMSCSSYWSSMWSGFDNLAARNDIDLVIHLGDYIYDFPDADELVRSRVGFHDMTHPDNRDWLTLDEVRRRYALWRSDPQFVRAHQQHPWHIIWDNHDLDPEYGVEVPTPGIDESMSTTTLADTTRAFYEWTPTRPVRADGSGEFVLVDDGSYPVPENSLLVYRRLRYGDLVDVFGIDAQSGLERYGLGVDSSHLHGAEPSLLGRQQFEWLTSGLSASTARWRLIANQAWFSPADIPTVVEGFPMPQIGIGRWAKFSDERTAIVRHLRGGRRRSAGPQHHHGLRGRARELCIRHHRNQSPRRRVRLRLPRLQQTGTVPSAGIITRAHSAPIPGPGRPCPARRSASRRVRRLRTMPIRGACRSGSNSHRRRWVAVERTR